jgi:hypothetical protein
MASPAIQKEFVKIFIEVLAALGIDPLDSDPGTDLISLS